jgi:hypothetical protein
MVVDITIGKRNRPLRFDLSAIQAAERALDKPIFEALREVHQLSLTSIVTLLWAGMRHAEPNQTPAKVTQMIETHLSDGGELQELIRALDNALTESVWFRSMLKDVDDDEPSPEKKPNGSPSG